MRQILVGVMTIVEIVFCYVIAVVHSGYESPVSFDMLCYISSHNCVFIK